MKAFVPEMHRFAHALSWKYEDMYGVSDHADRCGLRGAHDIAEDEDEEYESDFWVDGRMLLFLFVFCVGYKKKKNRLQRVI